MYWCRWLLLSVGMLAYAQGPSEIQVFEYEPLSLGAFICESHINYVANGTTKFEASIAPE